MKLPTSLIPIHWLLSIALVSLSIRTLRGETHCPGNIASVTPRLVAHALLVIPVKVDQQGPFDFMVDTGSQVTVIDRSLARQLALKPQGAVGLVATASYEQASITVLDSLETGYQTVERPLAVIHDLGQIAAADPRIRGVLGEDFLARFDVLIDYKDKKLCLDAHGIMRNNVRGERIALVSHPDSGLPFATRLVVAVHLSGAGPRQILLQLDSGSDSPVLYQTRGESRLAILDHATLRRNTVNASQLMFADLPAQELRVGAHNVGQVPFATPISVGDDLPPREEDGLLPTAMFQRVFISAAGHYVVLDPL
jgi:Aspartyl protease